MSASRLNWIVLLLAACSGNSLVDSIDSDDTLVVEITGSGHVSSNGGFIDCPPACSHTYPVNRPAELNPGTSQDVLITLTATPSPGWTLLAWGNACSGTALTASAKLQQDGTVTCTATFGPANTSFTGTWTLFDDATTVHSPAETMTITTVTASSFSGTNTVSGTITRDVTGTFHSATSITLTRWSDQAHTQCNEAETLTLNASAAPLTMSGHVVDCSTAVEGRAVLWKHN